MKVTVVINRFSEIELRQTTTMLIVALANRGHVVSVAEVSGVTRNSGATLGSQFLIAASISIHPRSLTAQNATAVFDQVRVAVPPATLSSIGDLLLIRTSPGRDIERHDLHKHFLTLATEAEDRGLTVINSPKHLWRMASKDYLMSIDERFRPVSMVSNESEEILQFVKQHGDCVIKPLIGSRGSGVIRIGPSSNDLFETIQAATKPGKLLVQEYVDCETAGDTRIVTFGSDILEVNGHAAAIRRIPAKGEFRANLHAGGFPAPASLTQPLRDAVNHTAALLKAHGVWIAGVDLVDDKLIEFNVFSTGGLYDAYSFTGQDFCCEIVSRLENLMAAKS